MVNTSLTCVQVGKRVIYVAKKSKKGKKGKKGK
jgi:hypothetical protein